MVLPSVAVVTPTFALSHVVKAALYPPGPTAGVRQLSDETAAETPATKSNPETEERVFVGKVLISVRSIPGVASFVSEAKIE